MASCASCASSLAHRTLISDLAGLPGAVDFSESQPAAAAAAAASRPARRPAGQPPLISVPRAATAAFGRVQRRVARDR